MTWRGVPATTLPLSERYHTEGNSAQTLVGEYVKSAIVWCVSSHQQEACDPDECQSFMNDLHTYSDDDFYVRQTCYATNRQSLFTTAQTMFLCLNNDKFQWPRIHNEHSMDSRLLCLHWQPLVRRPVLGLMLRTGAPETGNWVSGHCCI
jgi:hypothetical protein